MVYILFPHRGSIIKKSKIRVMSVKKSAGQHEAGREASSGTPNRVSPFYFLISPRIHGDPRALDVMEIGFEKFE
jgi:hypothetical protein